METQQATPAKGPAKSTAKPKAPPMINEIAAVGIGKFLTDAATSAEDKAKVENILAQFDQINIVHPQNTADVIHVVVPDYSGFEEAVIQAQALTDKDLEQVSGGEIGISAFFGAIGTAIVGGLTGGAIALGAGSTAAVVIGATAVVTTMALGFTIIAGVATAIGVGLASGLGAFDDQHVSIGHAS